MEREEVKYCTEGGQLRRRSPMMEMVIEWYQTIEKEATHLQDQSELARRYGGHGWGVMVGRSWEVARGRGRSREVVGGRGRLWEVVGGQTRFEEVAAHICVTSADLVRA